MAEQHRRTPTSRAEGHGAEAAAVEHVGAAEHHALPTALGLDAPQWIALAMVVVFAILIWKRVPALIGKALDTKIAGDPRPARRGRPAPLRGRGDQGRI